MYVVHLGRQESEFWNECPRRVIAMIKEWKIIEHHREKMRAIYGALAANGQDIPDMEEASRPVQIHPFYIG